MKGKRFESLM